MVLVPGSVALVGRISATPDAITKWFPPLTGVNSCFNRIQVMSPAFPDLQTLREYGRWSALAGALRAPDDAATTRAYGGSDYAAGSSAVVAGTADGHVAAATAMPFCVDLFAKWSDNGLFSKPIPLGALGGSMTVYVDFATAQNSMVQAGASTATWSISPLYLTFTLAPAAPAMLKQPTLYSTCETHVLAIDTGVASKQIQLAQPIISAAVTFQLTSNRENIGQDSMLLEAPAGLSAVTFAVNGEQTLPFKLTINDAYAAAAIDQFVEACVAGGMRAPGGRELVARGTAASARWRAANQTFSTADGYATSPFGAQRAALTTSITDTAFYVPDCYGLGCTFPPAGAAGTLSVTIESSVTSAAPYIAYIHVFSAKMIPGMSMG